MSCRLRPELVCIIICRRACHYLYGQARDKLLQLWHPQGPSPSHRPPVPIQDAVLVLAITQALRYQRYTAMSFGAAAAGCWPKILIYKCQHRAGCLKCHSLRFDHPIILPSCHPATRPRPAPGSCSYFC